MTSVVTFLICQCPLTRGVAPTSDWHWTSQDTHPLMWLHYNHNYAYSLHIPTCLLLCC